MTLDVKNNAVGQTGIRAWTPAQPNLYDIEFNLYRDGKLVDKVLSYFGMREITTNDETHQVLLNGVPLYQRLILDQGYWKKSGLTPPDEEALVKDIDAAKAAGYNGARKHMKVEDERWLYWADVRGFLVWSEMAAYYQFNEDSVANFTREWLDIVKQNYTHPSIIVWTPFNESWGVHYIATDIRQMRFTGGIYFLTKSLDPMRPVITNDGWEHTLSDIITLHDYEEKGEDFARRYSRLSEMLQNKIPHNKHKRAFAEGFAWRGQPVIITEYGGIAMGGGKEGWGYGNKVASKEEYLARLSSITKAIQGIEMISGFCYTQLTDVQQEINGIMDEDRNFKVKSERLREINEKKI
jgi:beta-galactosidase/beta-glucuronidase